ncbi:MAG: MFS transporter [Rhodospirillaceae bacterium]|nr:MFS transporter [Rhodospirillaceae bacterium]
MIGLRLSLFYATYFGMVGIMLPFFPVWLLSKGVSAAEIGLILGSATFARIIFNPIIGQIADLYGTRQPIIFILAVLSSLCFSSYFIVDGFWMIILVTIIFNGFWSGMQPLAESLTMLSLKQVKIDYGRVRLWGSIAFILTALIAGKIIGIKTDHLILILIFLFTNLMIVVTLFLPKVKTKISIIPQYPLSQLFRNYGLIIVIFSAALIQSSHALYYSFGSIHWKTLGFSSTAIGLLWAEGVVAEIILFSFGAYILRWIGALNLIFLGGFLGMVRWFCMAYFENFQIILFTQLLHAFSFGATHLGIIHYLNETVEEGLSVTALSLYSAIGMGLLMGIMVSLSGGLYDQFGSKAYLLCALTSIIGAALVIMPGFRRKGCSIK